MKIEIKIPKMGESIVEATIGAILKPPGSIVRVDEEVLEIETDKVNQVLTAPAAGTLELNVKTGDTVKVDQVIGFVDPTGAAEAAAPAPAPKPSAPASPAAAPTPKPSAPPAAAPAPTPSAPPAAAPTPTPSAPPAAAPTPTPSAPPAAGSLPPARKKADAFMSELTSPAPQTAKPEPAPAAAGKQTRTKMTKLRRVIAERLVKVKNETAMLTTFNEVDMSAVMRVREENQEQFQKKHGIKLGMMSFFVKACISALQAAPDLNARIEGDEIVRNNFYDIGVAVGTDRGLFVPVVRNADQLSYAAIEKQIKLYAEQARNGTISVDAMQGGTFTITNGGVYGSLLATPILNPPQSGILGMHNIVKRPVVVDDQIVIRPMMYIALSYDHRIVDGKESITFLTHIKKHLEDPVRFLLDL